MYAVIRTGGKQVKVSEGSVVEVERQNINPGDSIKFSEVLMMADGDKLNVGTPLLEKANVFGTVLDIYRSPKVLVFKKKRRKQYRRTRGHRQYLIRVRIDELGLYEEPKKPHEVEPGKVAKPAQPEIPEKPEERKRVAAKHEAPPKKGTKVASKAPAAKKASPREKASAKKKEAPKSKAGKARDKKKK